MTTSVTTVFPFHPVRWLPPGIEEGVGHRFEESGVVDYVSAADVLGLSSFVPQQLSAAAPTSAADNASWYESSISLAVAATKHPGLGVVYGGLPAIRQGPAQLFRTALTLSNLTNGKAMLWVAVGELYNLKPFGYRRSEGLAHYEDHFRLYNLLWERDSPFDFEGNIWSYKNAFIGKERGPRPQFWSMGAGPRFLKIAAKYADGWVTTVPFAASTPEAYARRVSAMRDEVERAGRDPDAFGFGVIPMCLIHESPEVVAMARSNPMIRLAAALWGRLPHKAWRAEGVEPLFPDDWDYSVRWDASKLTDADFASLMGRISDEMVRKAFIAGAPQEVTDVVKAYVDAGATLVSPIDMLGSRTYNFSDAEVASHQWTEETLKWRLEMCRQLKEGR
ncbi:LLM class flavin-dependent oxidoreductase [Mycolicibacterium stellerae]|uniref:LLM class flavin-dependent oxidoreductase n=1 Tax=Mycolicibacterium stellerae TaxID=2358193 RepID=UPI000F0B4160|nr:LLM class flavin-dependent oxidoreductase [Mycolicibacterium stellerae]